MKQLGFFLPLGVLEFLIWIRLAIVLVPSFSWGAMERGELVP